MLCSREIFTDQSYHVCIRSEKNLSIRSDACMTEDYARGQPDSAWPLAGQPCNFDCNLHTIARAHNRTFFVRLVRALCPHVPAVECSIMCTPIMHSTRSKLVPKWHFPSTSDRPALSMLNFAYRNFSSNLTPTCRCRVLKLGIPRVLELGVGSARSCSL